MITYGDIVSRIQNTLNSVNKDMFIPPMYILHILKEKASFFIAQKFNEKSLFRETNLYKWIRCVELVPDDVIKCGKVELERCESLMKTKKPLPKLLWSRYGPSIILVTTIDDSKKFIPISPMEYTNLVKRPGSSKFLNKYCIIYPDNTLYLPNSTIEKVNVLLFSLDEKAEDSSTCSECSKCDSYWEREVTIPDKIREMVVQETIKEVSMRLQIPVDANPNLDSNIKSQSVQ